MPWYKFTVHLKKNSDITILNITKRMLEPVVLRRFPDDVRKVYEIVSVEDEWGILGILTTGLVSCGVQIMSGRTFKASYRFGVIKLSRIISVYQLESHKQFCMSKNLGYTWKTCTGIDEERNG